MAIASRVREYMVQHGISYDVVTHPHSRSSMETVALAHVPGKRLAKSVVLEDEQGFVLAVLPPTCQVRLGILSKELKRKLRLAAETELPGVFTDCEPGAVPPLGPAYGMATVIDDSVAAEAEIYFEAGDHERLIHLRRDDFFALMDRAGHARFAAPM